MFGKLKQRLNDARTINILCTAAEQHANAAGQQEPAAEHFVLAALELPDGSARRCFERIGADAGQFSAAIDRQHRDALKAIGVDETLLEAVETDSVPRKHGIYRAQPSGQALMQRVADQAKQLDEPLSGAHVVLAMTLSQLGVTPRALRDMGIDMQALASAARAEIESLVRM
jgi:ATP-dependent Clp protease ATP-binding subunit ClpA